MTARRHRILGLARPRSKWFGDVSLWSNTGLLAADFVKCVSALELSGRLETAPDVTAVMVEPDMPGVTQQLRQLCAQRNVAFLSVSEMLHSTDDVAVDPATLTVENLRELLIAHCDLEQLNDVVPSLPHPATPSALGRIVAVMGTGNTGASVVACGLAQTMATKTSVLLADLKRQGDLGMMHDAPDVVPNFEDLVHACRSGAPSEDVISSVSSSDSTFEVDAAAGDKLLAAPFDCEAERAILLRNSDRTLWLFARLPDAGAALQAERLSPESRVIDVWVDASGDCKRLGVMYPDGNVGRIEVTR